MDYIQVPAVLSKIGIETDAEGIKRRLSKAVVQTVIITDGSLFKALDLYGMSRKAG